MLNAVTGIVVWSPVPGGIASGLITLLLAGWLLLIYQRSLRRHGRRRALILLAPKLVILLLLLLALFDPHWGVESEAGTRPGLITVLDVSSSMDLPDSENRTRVDRARAILSDIQKQLSDSVDFRHMEFDTELRESNKRIVGEESIRGTDIGSALLGLSKISDMSGTAGILMLTDGGDDPVKVAQLPDVPLYIVGVGAARSAWDDVRIAEIDAPLTVEENTEIEITCEIDVRGTPAFRDRLDALTVILRERISEASTPLRTKVLRPSGTTLRHTFRLDSGSIPGVRRFSVEVVPSAGEITALNNRRDVLVNIRKRSVNVLLFSDILTWDVSILRQALDADPGIRLTCVTRVAGSRYLLQGDIAESKAGMPTGFPADVDELSQYQCVILGSFPMSNLSSAQRRALIRYVDHGGSLVLLGGEHSFEYTGVKNSISPLFPWSIGEGGARLIPGIFPLGAARGAAINPIVAGTLAVLSDPADQNLMGLNRVGDLKPGATALFVATVRGMELPVIALHTYGKGAVIGIASNTLWMWRRSNDLRRRAYDIFWGSTVRYLSGAIEGGRFLSVRWDRDRYRPGELAEAEIRVTGYHAPGELRIEGMLSTGTNTEKLAVEPDQSVEQLYTCRVLFPQRADYDVSFEVFAGPRLLERYEKALTIGSFLTEGSALEVNHTYLQQLTKRPEDRYATESEVSGLVEQIRNRAVQATEYITTPLLEVFGIYAALLLITLLAEWLIRRRFNLF